MTTKSDWPPILVPVVAPFNIFDRECWEHPPLDYARYGEYPRYLKEPRPSGGETKIAGEDFTRARGSK